MRLRLSSYNWQPHVSQCLTGGHAHDPLLQFDFQLK